MIYGLFYRVVKELSPAALCLKLIPIFAFILFSSIPACQKKPENIIIISIDALRQSAVNAYNPNAPELKTLDAFARQAVVFKHAYSSASWTLPAHGSLFSGCYPDRHGAIHQQRKLSEAVPALAEELRQAGFYTAAFTDGGYVSRSYGFARGFDRYNDWVNPSATGTRLPLPRNGRPSRLAGEALFDRGIEFINNFNQNDKGFFLFLHTYVVHDYFKLHPWAVNRLPAYPEKGENHYRSCIKGKTICPPEDWERLKSLYQAELYRVDEGLANLLAALDNNDLRDSTWIIFLSDHGEGFDPARNRIHHGGRLHEDLITIPLMISGPRISSPRISNTAISLVDMMPTVLDILRIPIPSGVDGTSVADALLGKNDVPSKACYAMEHFFWWDSGRRHESPRVQDSPISIAVIQGEDWYIRDRNGEELYHMNDDPRQTRDLSSVSPRKSGLAGLTESRNIFKPSAPAVVPEKETIDQLKSLGYVE